MNKILLLVVLLSSILLGNNQETKKIQSLVSKVSSQIKYGVGKDDLLFNDEIIKYGEGHCGHLSWMLMRELLKEGYKGEIISITTYNKRNHSLVQITRKDNKKKILVDATTNLVYQNSVEEILEKPILAYDAIGNSKSPAYSNIAFWESVKNLRYIPFIGNKVLNNIKSFSIKNPIIAYSKPNDIQASLDHNYATYFATKTNVAKKVNITILFKKQNRLSSIVVYPYSTKNYPKRIRIKCDDKMIYNKEIELKRSMIIMNLYGNDRCTKLSFEFSDFQGQNRLLLRDIYIYGK